MAGLRFHSFPVGITRSLVLLGMLVLGQASASGQVAPATTPPLFQPMAAGEVGRAIATTSKPKVVDKVVDVRVVGNGQIAPEKIRRHIHTRAGRPFSSELIEEDVLRLNRTGWFVKVKPLYQTVPEGRIITFELLERPILHEILYIGNRAIKKKILAEKADIEVGDALDPYSIDEAARRIEDFYREKGFSGAKVKVAEGKKTTDRRAIFVINEGVKTRILWTQFIGNSPDIATDARLRTQIESKPGIAWVFNGELDMEQVEEDKNRLLAYYRGLGFFRATVGRELDPTDDQKWTVITFVIDEGPRYVVRNISFIGNKRYTSEDLANRTELKAGQDFNQSKLVADEAKLQELYGRVGHIYASVDADIRFLEEPGELNLIYKIDEGGRYKVGRVNVDINGEYPHTNLYTVLNRLSTYPGDYVDSRELRDSERRMKAAQIFEVDPTVGSPPRIVVDGPKLQNMDTQVARQPPSSGQHRHQSPDPEPRISYRPPSVPNEDRQTSGPDPDRQGFMQPSQGTRLDWYEARLRSAMAAGRREAAVVRGQYTSDGGHAMPSMPTSPTGGSSMPSYQPIPSYSPPPVYRPPSSSTAAGTPAAPNQVAPGTTSAAPAPVYVSPFTGSPNYGGSNGPGTPASRSPLLQSEPLLNSPGSLMGLPPEDQALYVPINPQVYETRTGRFLFSVGVNSDAGLLGSIVIDEQNFDWTRFPRSFREIGNGTAWRGAGQQLRLEAVPGTQVQRYSITFQEPYLMNTNVSLGLSAYLYNRWYDFWQEERLGGRVSLGYRFSPDLTGAFSLRAARINVYDPIASPPPELAEVIGSSSLFGFRYQLTHDTRDNAFLATEGHLIQMSAEYVTGTYDYPRAEVDIRKYFLLRQRPDGSGRHVLAVNGRVAVTGDGTPLYEHYYAGGFSTLRGFDFRGASPKVGPVEVGGHFLLLASTEYLFSITADDNLRAVLFCDTGTVEPTINDWSDKYRVAPGFGLRISVPAMGQAPIALDFAFPIVQEDTDDKEVFSFFIGFLR